jgi:type II secretory pathway component PulC
MRALGTAIAWALGVALLSGCAPAREPLLAPPPAGAEDAPTPSERETTTRPATAADGEGAPLTRAMLRETVGRGPARVLAALEFAERPVFRDGRFVGLRVLARRDVGASRRLFDVRPGDVVTAVNGVAPRTPEDLAKAVRAVLEASAVEVALLRDGQPLVLRVPVQGD